MSAATATTPAPRERPIIFSGPMVRAILAGEKTQTRRVMRPQPLCPVTMHPTSIDTRSGALEFTARHADGRVAYAFPAGEHSVKAELTCPYGAVGGLLYVRETWRAARSEGGEALVEYRADPDPPLGRWQHASPAAERAELPYVIHNAMRRTVFPDVRWRPSIHMPKWASRIWLRVTDLQGEWVQDISGSDAEAEGIERSDLLGGEWRDYQNPEQWCDLPRDSFRTLWDSINQTRGFGWHVNTLNWAVTFERCGAPA